MKALRLSTLCTRQPPPYLFQGFLRDQSITLVTGPTHSAKSMLFMEMAICLDYNLPLFGLFKPRRITVPFLLGADAPDWDYGLQLQKLLLGRKLNPQHFGAYGLIGRDWHFGRDETLNEIVRAWEQHRFDVLFIDTLRKTKAPSMSENSADDMISYMGMLQALQERLQIAIFVAHHTSKPQRDDPRTGSYRSAGNDAIPQACDFHLNLSKRSNKIKLETDKSRGQLMEQPVPFFEVTDVDTGIDDSEGKRIWGLTLTVPGSHRNNQLLRALAGGPQTRQQLITAFAALPEYAGLEDTKVARLVDNAIQDLRASRIISSPERGSWEIRR